MNLTITLIFWNIINLCRRENASKNRKKNLHINKKHLAKFKTLKVTKFVYAS